MGVYGWTLGAYCLNDAAKLDNPAAYHELMRRGGKLWGTGSDMKNGGKTAGRGIDALEGMPSYEGIRCGLRHLPSYGIECSMGEDVQCKSMEIMLPMKDKAACTK